MTMFADTLRSDPGRSLGLAWPAVVAWIAIAMLPCTVFAAGGQTCPGCPPEQHDMRHALEGGHPPGHGHAAHAANSAASEAACGHAAQDCCDDVAVAPDDRSKTPERPGKTDVVVAGLPAPAQANWLAPSREAFATGPPPARAPSRRLHLLNCVYLD